MIQKIKVDIDTIKSNSLKVQERVSHACAACGRNTDSVKVICVTKYVYPETVAAMAEAGFRSFGENRVEEILTKDDYCSQLGYSDIDWHMIGHLQSNKVKRLANKDYLIHSCDSISILEKLDNQSKSDGITRRVMLEFNISGEETKSGFNPNSMGLILDKCPQYKNLSICGIMTMAPKGANEHLLRHVFASAHKMYVDIGSKNIDNMPMMYLSMGMSGDFEIAISEGANLVRIGSTFYS